MSVAMALTACAVALAATLGDEPERAIVAEPAADVFTREPAVRPDSLVKPRVETVEHVEHPPTVETTRAEPKTVRLEPPEPEALEPEVEAIPRREPAPEPAPHPEVQPRAGARPLSEAKPSAERKAQPRPAAAPQPKLGV